VVASALFAVASSALFWSAAAHAADAPTVIRIGSPDLGTGGKPSASAGPLTVAQTHKWLEQEFAKDGIKIEWNFFRGAGPAIAEGLAAKQLDVVFLGDLASVIGRARGLPTKYIFASGRGSNSYLATAPGVDIKTVADLKGKKVSVLKGTAYQRPFDNLLASAGLTEKDVKLINLDWPSSKSAVVAKEIDATFGGSDLFLLKDKGVNIPISTKGRGAEFKIDGGVLATEDFIAKYPEVTARLVRQLVRAAHFASQESNREAFIKHSGNPELGIRSEFEGENLKVRFSPLIDDDLVADYQRVVDEGLKLGLIRQGFAVKDWFAPQFVQQAVKDLKLEKFWTELDAQGKAIKAKAK
jgi:sulfonate transport system substrate-binding protein